MRYAIVVSALVAAFATACGEHAAPSKAQPKPNLSVSIVPWLSSDEVAQVSKHAATSNGIELEKYYEPSVSAVTLGEKVTWRASFQMKHPTPPGGHFTVIVDDSTKKATYIAGE